MRAADRTVAQPVGQVSACPTAAPASHGIGLKIPPRDGCVWHPCQFDIGMPPEGVPIVGRWARVPPAPAA